MKTSRESFAALFSSAIVFSFPGIGTYLGLEAVLDVDAELLLGKIHDVTDRRRTR